MTVMRVRLRPRDMDQFDRASAAAYNALFLEARAELLKPLAEGKTFVLVRCEIDFLHEIRPDDGFVDVSIWPIEVTNPTLTVRHEMTLPDCTVAARCLTTCEAWDVAAGLPRRLLRHELQALAPHTRE